MILDVAHLPETAAVMAVWPPNMSYRQKHMYSLVRCECNVIISTFIWNQ